MIFWICITIVSFQLLLVIVLKIGRLKGSHQHVVNTDRNLQISVIIPFHNEEKRIIKLINSLNKFVDNQSVEFIFVNDYSTDNTCGILQENLKVKHKILPNNDRRGKKFAIRQGVHHAQHNLILTLDADVCFGPTHFDTLKAIKPADMNILPVHMTSSSLIGKLGIVEFNFLKFLGQAMGRMNKPIIANGASLLFKKSYFLAVDQQRKDYPVGSGDDQFLLDAFLRNEYTVHTEIATDLTVVTEAPSNMKALLQQRKRWISKMVPLLNASSLLSLFMLIAVQLVFVTSLSFVFFDTFFLIPLGIKFVAELIILSDLLKRYKSMLPLLVLHQFWYPVYGLLLGLPMEKEEKWSRD